MYKYGIRALAAMLIALSATVGIQQNPSIQPPQNSPTVLDSSITATQEVVPSPIATISAQATIEPKSVDVPRASSAAELKQRSRDEKVRILQKFLQKYNSPMTDNAQDFVDAAEQYELDWRLIPAIAGVESTFGKNILPGSYNAFGWGGGYIRFESFRDCIYTVSEGVSKKYVKDGLDTPHKMQPRYAPPSHTWGTKVQSFMDKIESTSEQDTANSNQ